MNVTAARGVAGRLVVGGRTAATLGKWTLTEPGGTAGWHLTAEVTQADDYWLTAGPPFELRLEFGRSILRSPATGVTLDGATPPRSLTASGATPFEKA